MFKLVVLSALIVASVAKPSGIHGSLAYSAVVAPTAVVQKTVLSSPVVTSYDVPIIPAAPVIQKTVAVASAPIVATAPVVQRTVAIAAAPIVQKTVVAPAAVAVPTAVSSSYRTDIISKPVVAAYAAPAISAAPIVEKTVVAPVVQKSIVAAAPVAVPSAFSTSYRTDIISKPVINTYAATYAAPAVVAPVVQKAVVAAPVLQKAVVAAVPSSYSHTFRSDVVVSKPALAAYTAPAISYAAPAISYAAPAFSYAAPALSYAAPALSYAGPAISYAAHAPVVKAW